MNDTKWKAVAKARDEVKVEKAKVKALRADTEKAECDYEAAASRLREALGLAE